MWERARSLLLWCAAEGGGGFSPDLAPSTGLFEIAVGAGAGRFCVPLSAAAIIFREGRTRKAVLLLEARAAADLRTKHGPFAVRALTAL